MNTTSDGRYHYCRPNLCEDRQQTQLCQTQSTYVSKTSGTKYLRDENISHNVRTWTQRHTQSSYWAQRQTKRTYVGTTADTKYLLGTTSDTTNLREHNVWLKVLTIAHRQTQTINVSATSDIQCLREHRFRHTVLRWAHRQSKCIYVGTTRRQSQCT